MQKKRAAVESFDVVVVVGGTAGIAAALTARHEGARVALIERAPRLGGDCTFTGCVPSKALIEVAQLVHDLGRLSADGILGEQPPLDFGRIAARRSSRRLCWTSGTSASSTRGSTSTTVQRASSRPTSCGRASGRSSASSS